MDGGDMTLVESWQFVSAGGLPLVLFLIIITGYKRMWVWGSTHDREIARADKAEGDRDRYARLFQDKALPAIIAFTQAANRVLEKESRHE